MRSLAVATAVTLLITIGTGCSSSSNQNSGAGGSSNVGGGSSTGGAGGGASTVVVNCPSFTKDGDNFKINATAASNYSFTSTVKLGEPQTVKAKTDITFNWSTLNKDMFNQPMDAKADVGNLGMLLVHMTKDQLQAKINDDSLDIQDRTGAATYLTGGTKTQASTANFDLLGQPLAHDVLMGFLDETAYPTSEYTYMVMLGSGNNYGKNGRMLGIFAVSSSASSTEVTIGPNSTTCTYEATLDKLTPVVFPTGTNKIMFDWSALTKTAAGRDRDFVQITKVMVADYTQGVADLQKDENFLNLQKLAVNTWSTMDLAGTTLDLSMLKNDKDSSDFPGIDSSHTWILALENTDALNPAPWYITVLQPCK